MKLEFIKDDLRYSKPAFGEKSQASIAILYIAYIWTFGSLVAHFWVWQHTHQGLSDYSVFVFVWLGITATFGAALLAAFIVLAAKPKGAE